MRESMRQAEETATRNQVNDTKSSAHKMSKADLGLGARLAGLFSIRMLGIFIILPIYSLYTTELSGSTPLLAGLFISSYALTQIILQPLFGSLSDYFGRKITIVIGMILFVLGSLLIAFTDSIYIAILGRVIQGAGAISAVVLAFTSDVVREEIRGKTMALIGISIGLTFGLAIFISPVIYGFFGGMGIFLLCAILGIAGIYVTLMQLPKSEQHKANKENRVPLLASMKEACANSDINRLYLGAFMLHLILTLGFTIFPWILEAEGYMPKESWKIYVPSFLIAIFLMFPCVGVTERFRQFRIFFLISIGILITAMIALVFVSGFWSLMLLMTLFFLGFNSMEAIQPSLMSRLAPEHNRGMVMGFFSSSQFLGASVGGIVASLIYGYSDIFTGNLSVTPVLLLGAGLLGIWFVLAFPMKNPQKKEVLQADAQEHSQEENSGGLQTDL